MQFQRGHLASVHDHKENDFLMVNLKRNNIDNAFLGLHVNNDDQLEWTDGTVLDYESWNTGGMYIHTKDTQWVQHAFIF